jgi:hypothetical protein
MKTYLAFIFCFILCGCESKEEKIKTHWKYEEGFHFGDFLSFENSNSYIVYDTFYFNSTPIAIIKELKVMYFLGSENKLILKDIKSGKIGIYTDKGK